MLLRTSIPFPKSDQWVAVIPAADPLAGKPFITPQDLIGRPLFCSEQSWKKDIPGWAGNIFQELHLEGSFRLAYNASIFAKRGLGCLLAFDKLIDTSEGSGLKAIPLSPSLTTPMYLIWKKEQIFSPIAERFISELKRKTGAKV